MVLGFRKEKKRHTSYITDTKKGINFMERYVQRQGKNKNKKRDCSIIRAFYSANELTFEAGNWNIRNEEQILF
jgi:hypothetical protein